MTIDKTLPSRHLMSTVLAGLLVLAACGEDGDDEDVLPVVGGGTGGTGTAGAAGAIGAGADGAGAAGVGTGTAGASGAGASGAGAGAAGSSTAGLGGAGASTGGAAASGTGGAAGAPDAGAADPVRMPATGLSLPTVMESGGVEPWFNIYRPMDLTATGAKLPVIVWANGGCFRSDFTWAPLFERWAKGGFVVLALTEHPVDGPLAQTSVEEHGALVDWALDKAPFKDMLDQDAIVAAGNSCGGITALGLAAADDRVDAVFVLSGSSAFSGADTAVIGAITVPVGYVVGGAEDIAGANANADYDALEAGIPAMIISRSSGDHMTVSTDTMILPQVAEMALNWMDLALYGTKEAADALKSATICTGCMAGVWKLKSKDLEALQK
jgi:predicted dienelactone hydrolase